MHSKQGAHAFWAAYPSVLLMRSYRVLGVTDSKQASIHVMIDVAAAGQVEQTKIADLRRNYR
jgi:hypothetical protein